MFKGGGTLIVSGDTQWPPGKLCNNPNYPLYEKIGNFNKSCSVVIQLTTESIWKYLVFKIL